MFRMGFVRLIFSLLVICFSWQYDSLNIDKNIVFKWIIVTNIVSI